MRLEKLITLANRKVRLYFLAMERSLRAVGCDLPLLVIPYDEDLFELPRGANWWKTELSDWLRQRNAHATMRKYQCLTVSHYQFVDTDVCFLRNPETVLEPYEGFITSCGHWHNTGHTVTEESKQILAQKSTIWQQNVFNTGQFACDRPLYDFATLTKTATQPQYMSTCLLLPYHEQPGMNLLVALCDVTITNLTLPPVRMQSTWAGDYDGDPAKYWNDPGRMPYLIHWAGKVMTSQRPINQIFYSFLTQQEKQEFDEMMKQERGRLFAQRSSLRAVIKRYVKAVRSWST